MIVFSRNLFRSVLLLFLLVQGISAQTYPVQVNVIATPPYRNYMASYAEQGAMKVFVTFTDFNSAPIQVRLRMTFSGPGYMFESDVPTTYQLNPGETMILEDDQLTPYLNSTGQSGINAAALPYGNTKVCFEVHRVQNNELLSNPDLCSYFEIGKAMPVQLYRPECNSTVTFSQSNSEIPDPVEFTWTPPFIPIGFTATNSVYIYQWSLNGVAPPQVPLGMVLVDSIPNLPAFQSTAFYTPATSVLIKGQRYAYYIHTRLQSNTNQIENYGWSQPCVFQYGTALSLEEEFAQDLHVEWNDETTPGLAANTDREGAARWKVVQENGSSANYSSYLLSYRKKSEGEEYEWFEDTVYALNKAIYQLEPATTYEANVRGLLGSYISEPTETREFTTGAPRSFQCGVPDGNAVAAVYQPLMSADPGTKVRIGSFDLEFVTVQSTGVDGHYSGTGLVPIEFLFGAEAKVRFEDLKIDKSYNVVEGTANVVTDGLDNWLTEQYQQFQDPIFVNGTIDSAYVSDSLCHLVINGIDTTFTFPCPTCQLVFNDSEGNMVTVYPNGTVVYGSYLDVSDDYLSVTEGMNIQFSSLGNSEKFGTDVQTLIQYHEYYELIVGPTGYKYFVTNKSVSDESGDSVRATLSDSLVQRLSEGNDLVFKLGNETILSFTQGSQNDYSLFLPASEDDYEVYAYVGGVRFGKLNVYSYFEDQRTVHIIPMTSDPIDDASLKSALDNYFKGANIKLELFLHDQWNDSVFTTSKIIDIPSAQEVTLSNKYSEDMRSLRDAYLADNPEEQLDGYVLFIVPGFSSTELQGYMVRGKTLGFISADAVQLERTIAHELGHGIGALSHPWSEMSVPQGSSNLLMDYGDGEILTKKEWEELRNKGFFPSLFDDIENGEGTQGGKAYYYGIYVNISGGDTIVSHRKFLGQYEFYKNGPLQNPYCKKADYLCSVDKYFKWSNGEWVPFWYDGLDRVKYMVERVDFAYNHSAYTNHYDTKWFAKAPGESGTEAESIYTVKKLLRPGESESYSYKIYDAYLNEICDYINDGSSVGVRTYYFNDLWLSQEFLEKLAQKQKGKISTCNLLSWLENHPMADQWTDQARDNAVAKFNINTSDDHSLWLWGNGWSGKAIVSNGASALNGVSIHYVKLGPNGEWVRDIAYLDEPVYSNGSDGIHRKYGYKACSHSLSQEAYLCGHVAEMLENGESASAIAEFVTGRESCFLYGLPLETRKALLYKVAHHDYSWYENGKNFLYLIFSTASGKNDEVAMLKYLKSNNGYLLKTMYSMLSETWDPDDSDLDALKSVFTLIAGDVSEHKSEFPQSTQSFEKSFSVNGYVDPGTYFSNPPKIYKVPFAYVDVPIVLGSSSENTIDLGKIDLGPGTQQVTSYGFNSALQIKTFRNQEDNNISISSSGKIRIVQNYGLYEYFDGIQLYQEGSGAYNGDLEVFTINSIYELDPYDMVTVVIGENYGMNYFDKGDILQMPAICALLIQQAIDNQQFDERFRVVTDVVEVVAGVAAVAGAPITGGSSIVLYVSVVASVKGAVDLAVFSNQYGTTGEEYNASYYQNWAVISALVDVADGAVNLPGLVKGGIKIGGQLMNQGRSIAFAVALNRSIRLTQLSDNLGDLSKSVKARSINYAVRNGLTYANAYAFVTKVTKITSISELKAYLLGIDEATTIEQIEAKGINALFRGTTRNKMDGSLYPGNANSQLFGISTSTDPIKATIFAIESAGGNGAYRGVLQIGLTDNLKNFGLNAPNAYRCEKELEVVVKTTAENFSNAATIEMNTSDAITLIKEVYDIDLPLDIDRITSEILLETLPASSLEKAHEFYQKAIIYNTK